MNHLASWEEFKSSILISLRLPRPTDLDLCLSDVLLVLRLLFRSLLVDGELSLSLEFPRPLRVLLCDLSMSRPRLDGVLSLERSPLTADLFRLLPPLREGVISLSPLGEVLFRVRRTFGEDDLFLSPLLGLMSRAPRIGVLSRPLLVNEDFLSL